MTPQSKKAVSREDFRGPLFLVGLPRSGTKLLRELLNNHSNIRIPSVETEFLPYLHTNWRSYGNISEYQNFERFYRQMVRLPYFLYQRQNGTIVDSKTWYNSCREFSLSGVFEALVRHDTGVPSDSEKIWGDKSPSHVCHIRLLKAIFPSCKVIHITRDVRDYCLSINKAWGKNIFRAAQRWATDVSMAQEQGKGIGADYFSLRYEDLIERPERELLKICEFLRIPFEPAMVNLSKPSENIGDAANQLSIMDQNKGKWVSQLNQTDREKIEAIACETMRACGYSVSQQTKPKKLGSLVMIWYQFLDGLNLIRKRNHSGTIESIRFYWKYFKISGNRIKG